MNKKYGTTGHIEKAHTIKSFYQKTGGRKCIFRDNLGKCNNEGYINRGLDCKRPGACHKFIPKDGWLS